MRIEQLTGRDRTDVVAVLVAAFYDYPVMRFTLGRNNPDYDAHLSELVGYYADRRLLCGWPVLGLRAGGELVATALVSPPDPADDSSAVEGALDRLRRTIGEAAFDRMARFEQASDANEPPTRHYFVGMLGARPEQQRRGYGRMLLDEVHRLATERRYDGVCLSTEDPGNLAIYRRLGFQVIAEAQVDELRTWSLFRPCSPAAPGGSLSPGRPPY